MRKMESEIEKTQTPATGGMCNMEQHNVEEEAMMILQHGNMGPSSMAMEMETDDKEMS